MTGLSAYTNEETLPVKPYETDISDYPVDQDSQGAHLRSTSSKVARPISVATTGTAASIVTIIRPDNFILRFSGAPGHPVHPRLFMKEFCIAMRGLGLKEDMERIDAFEDYLVVNSPAEKWFHSVRQTFGDGHGPLHSPEGTWKRFQELFLEMYPGDTFHEDGNDFQGTANAIKCVKFRQDAAVSAYIKATWIIPSESAEPRLASKEAMDDKLSSVKLGKYKPIATEETFVLAKYGIPDGAKVRFTSHVWGVGEEDQWFTHDASSSKGADFRQSGTAFKGWFNHTGRFEV